jgi:hypothetical protein
VSEEEELELCTTCGYFIEDHEGAFADNALVLKMMKKVSDDLPYEYHEVLEQILVDWRTHTLPACDPLAID